MTAKDFLSIKDFSPSEILYLLILARQVKTHPGAYCEALKRQTLALIFEKPSLRTRVSFDLGANEESSFNHPLCSSRVIGARNVLLLESCRGRKLLSSTPKARICLRMNH